MKLTVPAWLPLALLLALAGAIWVGVGQCQGRRAAEAKAAKADEAHRAEVEGLKAAQEATQRELDDRVRANGYLSDYAGTLADKVKAQAKVIASFKGSTGPVPIAPGVTITVGGNGQAASSPPSGAAQAPAGAAPSSAPSSGPAVCKAGEILIPAGAVWRTEAGNIFAATEGEAWCADPRAILFRGPVKADVSTLASSVPAAPRPGFGLGAAIAVGPRTWMAGPVVAAPPLRFLGLSWEPQASLVLSKKGEWVLSGAIIARGSK